MLRFFARFVGFWLVAAALVAAVVDGAKSIAASALVITPVAATWTELTALLSRGEAEAEGQWTAPWPLDIAVAWLLTFPTVAVLAGFGVFFLVLGAKRRRPSIGREFPA
jgi:hypothetical protein